MRYIFFLFWSTAALFGALIESEIESIEGNKATIRVDNANVGMSGFVVHTLAPDRSTIVNSAEVVAYDPTSKKATVELKEYTLFKNNNLPSLKLSAQKGDTVVLAYGYGRGLVIAPNEKIYYTLTRAMKDEIFVHPDVFATLLSYHGHPTPLKEDFTGFCDNVSVGLLFFYLEQNLYTVDCHTFKILGTQSAPLKQTKEQLPFYSRVEKIEANWFGEGSDELEDYEPYYYELLYKFNPQNETLIKNIVSTSDVNVTKLAKELGLGEKK